LFYFRGKVEKSTASPWIGMKEVMVS